MVLSGDVPEFFDIGPHFRLSSPILLKETIFSSSDAVRSLDGLHFIANANANASASQWTQ